MARTKKKLPVDNNLTEVDNVDWKALCQKLQDALAKEMIEVQNLTAERNQLLNDIARQVVVIQYLESKFR